MQHCIPKPQHPSPDRVRAGWLNLNGTWQFSKDAPTYDREITVPFSWSAPLSGIADPSKGRGYYRRTVRFDAEGDRLFLIFGAVDYETTVIVNGTPIGSHIGGYTRFEFDVTDAWDSFGENTIELEAADLDEKYQTCGKQGYGNCRGIWQTVWLERRPAAYITSFRISTALDGTITILYTLSEDSGDPVSASFGEQTAYGENGKIVFKIKNPRLWEPDDPYLYYGKLAYGRDTIETYFGIREVSAGRVDEAGHPYILLNGKPIFLAGVLDQSYNPHGFFTLPNHEEEEEEILRLKRLGINLCRVHIKPEEPRKLYYADLHGMLIMEDMPCFRGEPTPRARQQYESEMRDTIARDINHPSIIYWVTFNETWGLFTETEPGKKVFLPETQEWVREMYHMAKSLDPTRLVEDNSACRHDHVETDVLTWHFYRNGYRQVRENIAHFVSESAPGKTGEYIGENAAGDIPAMNSECGNVWGIADGGAGDSDLSWHYHYMMNELRLHDRLSGFVFTEFHDVVNEFNGYYRIDNTEKYFGYEGLFPGMSLRDLHARLFLATDCPPMRTLAPRAVVTVPLALSAFDGSAPGTPFNVRWQTVHTDRRGIERTHESGTTVFFCKRIGRTDLPPLTLTMPSTPGTVVLRLALTTPAGEVKMRNFLVFDVMEEESGILRFSPNVLEESTFAASSLHIAGEKWNGIGAGEVSFRVDRSAIPNYCGGAIRLTFEASSKQTMTKDLPNGVTVDNGGEDSLMLGYRVDPGANPNAFPMTDEYTHPATLTLSVEGQTLASFPLPDCPADSRGILSHHYQPRDDRLDETGSYGYLITCTIPAHIAKTLPECFRITLASDAGLSLFTRRAGRYPCGIDIETE